jgi:hypothetical protein
MNSVVKHKFDGGIFDIVKTSRENEYGFATVGGVYFGARA